VANRGGGRLVSTLYLWYMYINVQAVVHSGVHRVTGAPCHLVWVNTTAVRTSGHVDVMICSVLECASRCVQCTALRLVTHNNYKQPLITLIITSIVSNIWTSKFLRSLSISMSTSRPTLLCHTLAKIHVLKVKQFCNNFTKNIHDYLFSI